MPAASPITIRRMRGSAQARACARIMASSDPWLKLKRTFHQNLRLLLDPTKEVYIAFCGRILSGFVVLHVTGPFSGYLQCIAVAPESRGHGLGRQLIRFAEERMFRESPNVFLCVSSFNDQARRLYARLGYRRVGEFKDYIVKGHSEILMRKTLGPWATFKRGAWRPRWLRSLAPMDRANGRKRSVFLGQSAS